MKNQFFYTRKVALEVQVEGEPTKYKDLKDSFSLDIVLLSIETPTGRTVVLNHVHERVNEVPVRNKKGQVTAVRNERGMYQTEVGLSHEDSERFIMATSVSGETLVKNVD